MPKHKLHRDADELSLESDSGYFPRTLRSTTDVPRATREKWHQEAKQFTRPAKNGYNDPLSHLLLIDTLMRLRPDQLIRASSLRNLLGRMRQQLVWDAVTVGRILNQLGELANRESPEHPPLAAARDRFGAYFTFEPGIATYQWLAGLRKEAGEKFSDELEYLEKGLEPPARTFPVWDMRGLAA